MMNTMMKDKKMAEVLKEMVKDAAKAKEGGATNE